MNHIAASFENIVRTAASMFTGGTVVPTNAVERFYPPQPEDSKATLDWLLAQDLVEVKSIEMEQGGEPAEA